MRSRISMGRWRKVQLDEVFAMEDIVARGVNVSMTKGEGVE